MRAGRRRSRTFLLPLLLGLLLVGGAPAGERAPGGASLGAREEAGTGKARAAPESPRDRVAAWVLLAWVWATTLVSIGVLRLKIQECDRLQGMAFHEPAAPPPRDAEPEARA